MRTPATVGVVCGGVPAGLELAWTFDELPQAELRWVCDARPRHRRWRGSTAANRTASFDELLEDEDLDAIAFASSELAAGGRIRATLEADKHVFVLGLLHEASAEADALVATARARERRLVVAPPTLLRPEVVRLRELLDHGALGETYYLHAWRHASRAAAEIDALRDLGAEAVATVLDLLGDEPVEVVARGDSYLGRAVPDVVFAELRFATGITAHLHLSGLEGQRFERVSVAGSEATAVLEVSGTRRDVSVFSSAPAGGKLRGVGDGGRVVLELPPDDGTRAACSRFLAVLRSPADIHYGREAAAVVAVVEALGASFAAGGTVAPVAPRSDGPTAKLVALPGR